MYTERTGRLRLRMLTHRMAHGNTAMADFWTEAILLAAVHRGALSLGCTQLLGSFARD